MENAETNNDVSNNKSHKFFVFVIFISFGLIIFFYFFFSGINKKEVVFRINNGESINKIGENLKNQKIIRSKNVFKALILVFGNDKKISGGDYLFTKKSNVFKVSFQIAQGNHNIEPIKITLREGLNNEEISNILSSKLSGFDKNIFLAKAKEKEGYLFPDTYFWYPFSSPDEVINKMFLNFNQKISSLNIKSSPKNLHDIIVMASIIEKEASGESDAELISGILWRRLEKGMHLQVDASIITYKQKGLPDNPICNPGLVSIRASLEPKYSSSLFYLHDKKGNIYFANTYEKHLENIRIYLK